MGICERRSGSAGCTRLITVFGTFLLAMPLALPLPAQPASFAASVPPATQSSEAYHLPPAKAAQAEALGHIRTALHFGVEFWELAILVVLLVTGSASRLNRATERWTKGTPDANAARRWLHAILFSAILAALLYLAIDLPASAIGHAASRAYGISVESWAGWAMDEAKTFALTLLLELPLLLLTWSLLRWRWSRPLYWFWLAVVVVPLMLLGTFLLPSLVEPLFYNFEPLAQSHPALAAELERVVARTGAAIPESRMFLMKASAKSNGLNAYVSGFGASKRIVVWDTTADRMPEDEILFTFGHEAGHYVLHHIPKGLVLASIGIFALVWAVSLLAAWFLRLCGHRWQIPSLATLPGLVVLLLALAILQIVAEPIGSFVSRRFEHEADIYGQEAIHGIVPDPRETAASAFNHLGEAYLDDPHPNPFVVFWTYDHPSIQSRATFAAHYDPWQPGGRPRFFAK